MASAFQCGFSFRAPLRAFRFFYKLMRGCFFGDVDVLAAAGMRMGASSWLVATPVYSASLTPTQVEFDLRLPHDEYGKATKLSACELISGQSYTFDIKSDGSVDISLRVAGTVVLHLTASDDASTNDSTCTPTTLWVPRGRAGAVPS